MNISLLLTGVALAAPCEDLRSPPEALSPGADLRCMDLRGAELRGVDLSGADLSGARLNDADLRDAKLTGADLTGVIAEGTQFVGANLRGAVLRGAVLRFADVRGAVLDEADLCTADISATRNLGWAASTRGTRFCRSTRLPPELDHPEDRGWRYLALHREPREQLVSFRSFDGLGLFVYKDTGNDSGELDLFADGGLTVGVTVASLDLVPPVTDWSHRHWLSGVGLTTGAGFGAATQQTGAIGVVTAHGGLFFEPLSFLVLEGGGTWGFAIDQDLDVAGFEDDFALYGGVRIEADPLVAFMGDLARVVLR